MPWSPGDDDAWLWPDRTVGLAYLVICFVGLQAREKGGFRAENEEEYEDADGNVYNKRTYEDMKRQGLI